MAHREYSPDELLSLGFDAPAVTGESWTARWDQVDGDVADLVLRTLPPTIDFHTSGTTGEQRLWRRMREKVWAEAGMLADLVAPERPDAVVSFVPSKHLYGALTNVLMPAWLRAPVWYRSTVLGVLPELPGRRVVVVANPWIFTLLLENLPWVRSLAHLTVLHGGAMLPATAGELLAEAGPELALIVEVIGSTEAGGFATRRWRTGEPPPWTLFPDVAFAEPTDARNGAESGAAAGNGAESGAAAGNGAGSGADEFDGPEVPLVISSPRLAFRPDGQPPRYWHSDDFVEPLDERTFRFAGRRSRLVKINGRRVNLDEVEYSLRAVLHCADLAVVPVADDMIGEHVDLLVVPRPGATLADTNLAAGFTRIGFRPRRVHQVPRIDRSDLGKLRHAQTALITDAKAAT